MRILTPIGIWPALLGALVACGSAEDPNEAGATRGLGFGDPIDSDEQRSGTLRVAQVPTIFPGGGTSGAAQPLSPALAPDTSDDCDPVASSAGSAGSVQSVCFYGPEDAERPAAVIQQVVEVVGTDEWVHIRLTLNPDFVDNTYGDTAIGWGEREAAEPGPAGGAEPPAAPPPVPPSGDAPPPAPPPPGPVPDAGQPPAAAEPPAAREGRAGRADTGRPRPGGRGGHTFRDLLGSDHAELQLLDAAGDVAMHFRLDYLSESAAAPSGHASLGIAGGEGELFIGQPEWLLASTTSLARNLNACGLGSFIESSPPTDADYTPAAATSDWDYRVAYEAWISAEAFGSTGFGSARIENVHASPSKAEGNSVTVSPAPCPTDPSDPRAAPTPVPPVLIR